MRIADARPSVKPSPLTGHDHHYERTVPLDGVTYVVSGAGSKLRGTGTSDFTAVAENRLQFMIVEATTDAIRLRAVGVDGVVIDEFTLVKER